MVTVRSEVAAPIKLRPGDKLRIVFYERYDDEEDKWRGHTRSPDAGFHQFPELCGDYVVQDDGTTLCYVLLSKAA